MAAYIYYGDKNFDTCPGGNTTTTALDTHTINGARLTIDTDTRYCSSHVGTITQCNGGIDTVTISSALGGQFLIDGTNVKMIPYKGGGGTSPAQYLGLAISAATWTGSVVTITTATHSLAAGDWVAIGGMEPNAYNGIYQVTLVPSSTTFNYELVSDPGISTVTNGHMTKYLTVRQALGSSTSISGGSWSGGVVTVTANAHGLVTGDWVLIASVTPVLFNGYWQVTGYATNTFTFARLVTTGAWSSGGTATKTVQGFFLGCWSAFNAAPIPLGTVGAGTVPTTGYLKVKGVRGGNFTAGTLTIQGGTSPLATAIGAEWTGWIEVVGAQTSLCTVPRLGNVTATGEWFYPRTLPKTSTSITNSTTTATLTLVAHGVTTGSIITITGAVPAAYNGTFTVASAAADTLTYTMLSNPGGSASTQGDFTAQICTSGAAQSMQLPGSLANSYYAGAWVERAAPQAATYTWIASVVEVTLSAHGFVAGQTVTITFTSGSGTPSGEYNIVSVGTTATFSVALTGSGTAGNCTITSYEFYPAAGLVAANSVATNASVGKVCWVGTQGLLRFGSDGTNTNGYIPSSGLRIRVPNVLTINSAKTTTGGSGANTLPNATLATRWEFATTGGGVINLDKVNLTWFATFAQAFSLSLTNLAIHEQLIISELASNFTFRNVGVGQTAAQTQYALSMALCFAGGTMIDCVWSRATLAGSGNYTVSLTDIFGLTIINERVLSFVFRANATTGARTLLRVNNSTWTNNKIVGGMTLLTTCSNLTFTTTSYADRIDNTNTSATNPMYAFNITTNCNNIKVDGLNFFGLANRNPYNGLMYVAVGSINIKLRNVGTATTPLSLETTNGCRYVIASAAGAGCTDIEVKRVYTSTPATGMQNFDNSISGVIYESVWAGMTTSTTTFFPTFALASLNTQARGLITGYYPQINTAGQTSVYGTHFVDYFDYSTAYSAVTAGQIILYCNEKTAESPSATTYTVNNFSSVSGFNSVGVLQMPIANDEITWTAPTKFIGHTGFRAELCGVVYPATGVAALTITAGAWSGGVTTLTCGTHKLQVGDTVTVYGATLPLLYNGTFVVSAVPSTTQISYKQPTTPGSWVSGGTVSVPYLAATAGSWSTNYTSLTIGTHGLAAGDTITVVGSNPVAYSGTFTITNIVSATVVRYPQTDPGTWSSGGNIRVVDNINLTYEYNNSGTFRNLRVCKIDCAMASTGNGVITMADTSGLAVDDYIFGDGVGTGAKIQSISTNVSVTATVNNASTSTWPRTCYFSYLPNEVVASASVGFDLKIKAKTRANANTAGLIYIDIPTVATSTSIGYQYPLDLATITVQNIVQDSVYEVYNVDNSAILATGTKGTAQNIDLVVSAVASAGHYIRVRVRKSSTGTKYLPFMTTGLVDANLTTTIYVSQIVDQFIA